VPHVASIPIDDAKLGFHDVAEPYGTEIDVKEAGANLLEPDVLFARRWLTLTHWSNTDPAIPGNATEFELSRIDERPKVARVGTW
jgi:hypothetical protein